MNSRSSRLLRAAFALACVLPARAALVQDGGAGPAGGGGAPAGGVSGAGLESAADTSEGNLDRVERDQARIGLRVTSLREKMERLAQRYDDEGRTRNAALLREALQQYDGRNVADLTRELQRSLEQGNLSTVEQQDALAAALQDIYSVLRDRRDADELSRQADLARQGASELSFLAQNERALLSATRAATDRPGDLVRQALELLERLAQSLATAGQSAESAAAAAEALGDAALADALARQQRALAGEPDPTAQTQALLQEALAMLRERLQKPAAAAPGAALADELLAAADAARRDASQAADRAAEAMAQAHDQLERAAAAAEPSAAGPTAKPGAPGDAANPSTTGDAAKPTSPGDAAPPAPPGETKPAAGDGAQRPSTDPNDPLAPARTAMTEAAERLDAARDALERSERSLAAARNRAQALAAAGAQDAARQAAGMEDLAQRLEAVQPQEGPEMLDRTRQLVEDLARLAQSVDQGDPAASQASGQAAQASLDDLIRQLKERAARLPDEGGQAPDAAALDALAQQQQELRDRAHELMARLSELPDQKFSQAGERAEGSMQGAENALRSGDSEEAAVREEEAAEKLEEAAQDLAGERDRYEQLRQEEVLFRLGEELKSLADKQEAISSETKEIEAARGEAEVLGRSQLRTVARLATQERDLGVQAERLRAALESDGSVAFTFALERTRDDLDTAADLLSREQTGRLVQTVQADARQRVLDLLDVLDGEMQRRRDAKVEEAPPGAPADGPMHEPLVPTVAELLLVQRMEQAALARLENFQRLTPDLAERGELNAVERTLVERWAAEHARVSEMFRAMIPQGRPGADGAGGADGSAEGGADGGPQGGDGAGPRGGSEGGPR